MKINAFVCLIPILVGCKTSSKVSHGTVKSTLGPLMLGGNKFVAGKDGIVNLTIPADFKTSPDETFLPACITPGPATNDDPFGVASKIRKDLNVKTECKVTTKNTTTDCISILCDGKTGLCDLRRLSTQDYYGRFHHLTIDPSDSNCVALNPPDSSPVKTVPRNLVGNTFTLGTDKYIHLWAPDGIRNINGSPTLPACVYSLTDLDSSLDPHGIAYKIKKDLNLNSACTLKKADQFVDCLAISCDLGKCAVLERNSGSARDSSIHAITLDSNCIP